MVSAQGPSLSRFRWAYWPLSNTTEALNLTFWKGSYGRRRAQADSPAWWKMLSTYRIPLACLVAATSPSLSSLQDRGHITMALGSVCPASRLCGSPHRLPGASTPPDSCAGSCCHSRQAARWCCLSALLLCLMCPHVTNTPGGSQRNSPVSKEQAFSFNLR